MSNAAGAQQDPIYCMLAGVLNVSLDKGVTWNPVVAGGGTVSTAAPVSGDGSSGNKITIAAAAIALTKVATQADQTLLGNVSGGVASPVALTAAQVATFLAAQSRAPDWFGAMSVYFQQQTGITPLGWSVIYENDFGASSFPVNGAQSQGFVFSGTGATAAYQNLTGGVVKVTGPTSGAGFSDWDPGANQTNWTTLGNLRTKRWMIGARLSIGKAPGAASAVSLCGINQGSNFLGLGYSGAQTNWFYSNGTAPTNTADTGKTITVDATGATGYLSMCLGNFDLAHVAGNIDLVGTSFAAPTNFEAIANAPNAAGAAYFYNEGTGAGDIYFLDKVIVCAEL